MPAVASIPRHFQPISVNKVTDEERIERLAPRRRAVSRPSRRSLPHRGERHRLLPVESPAWPGPPPGTLATHGRSTLMPVAPARRGGTWPVSGTKGVGARSLDELQRRLTPLLKANGFKKSGRCYYRVHNERRYDVIELRASIFGSFEH